MRLLNLKDESGKIGYIILWLLGVPKATSTSSAPVLSAFYFL